MDLLCELTVTATRNLDKQTDSARCSSTGGQDEEAAAVDVASCATASLPHNLPSSPEMQHCPAKGAAPLPQASASQHAAEADSQAGMQTEAPVAPMRTAAGESPGEGLRASAEAHISVLLSASGHAEPAYVCIQLLAATGGSEASTHETTGNQTALDATSGHAASVVTPAGTLHNVSAPLASHQSSVGSTEVRIETGVVQRMVQAAVSAALAHDACVAGKTPAAGGAQTEVQQPGNTAGGEQVVDKPDSSHHAKLETTKKPEATTVAATAAAAASTATFTPQRAPEESAANASVVPACLRTEVQQLRVASEAPVATGVPTATLPAAAAVTAPQYSTPGEDGIDVMAQATRTGAARSDMPVMEDKELDQQVDDLLDAVVAEAAAGRCACLLAVA